MMNSFCWLPTVNILVASAQNPLILAQDLVGFFPLQ